VPCTLLDVEDTEMSKTDHALEKIVSSRIKMHKLKTVLYNRQI
jgi:hypothetical protein